MPPTGKTQAPPGQQQESALQLDEAPKVKVLGQMDGNPAIRLGWTTGVHSVSVNRLRFLRDELEMEVIDNPDDYVL